MLPGNGFPILPAKPQRGQGLNTDWIQATLVIDRLVSQDNATGQDPPMPSQTPPDKLLLEFSLLKFDEITAIVAALGDDLATRALALPGANTPYGILNHCLGMMRRWSSSVNRGIEIPRDRDAEFTKTGPVTELLMRSASVREAFIADSSTVNPADPPAVVPEGREIFWSTTTRGVLLHVFEELCQHLGQLEITRDILIANAENH